MVWLHWSMVPVMFCDSILMNHGMLYWCGTMVSCNTGSCVQSHNHLPVIVIYLFIIFLSCTTSEPSKRMVKRKGPKIRFYKFLIICFGMFRSHTRETNIA